MNFWFWVFLCYKDQHTHRTYAVYVLCINALNCNSKSVGVCIVLTLKASIALARKLIPLRIYTHKQQHNEYIFMHLNIKNPYVYGVCGIYSFYKHCSTTYLSYYISYTKNGTHSLSSEKLKTEVSNSSCSSIRSWAWAWRALNCLTNRAIRPGASSFVHSCRIQSLERKLARRLANISLNRVRSWDMISPFACIRGPTLCLPRATRFFRWDHLPEYPILTAVAFDQQLIVHIYYKDLNPACYFLKHVQLCSDHIQTNIMYRWH